MKHLSEDLVKGILRDFPETRDSDKKLYIRVFEHEGLYLTPEQQEIFSRLPSLETFRRTRQKLQEQGYYKPSQRVKDMRMHKEVEMRQGFMTKDDDWDWSGPYPVLKGKLV